MIHVGTLSDMPFGHALRLELDPPVAVFRTDDGEIYAIDDTCTHVDASLSAGWLEGCSIECPVHESRFDLRTGMPECRPARLPVRTHQVVIEDDIVYLVLSSLPPPAPRRRAIPAG